MKNAEMVAELSYGFHTAVLNDNRSTFCAPRRSTPRRRARELLDIIMMVDWKEKSAAVNPSKSAA